MLLDNTVDELVRAAANGIFDEIKPRMLTLCQCNLVEIIGELARRAATDPHDVVA